MEAYCALPLMPFACRPDQSRGRVHDEPESAHRNAFQRDRDRIIHCTAFRRLKYKTQVFVYHEGDHYRTRLTHTLEVAQIARTIARALQVSEDLAEAVALSHDLGHPPFAHTGEDVLVERMKDLGGFDHNDQSLRIVTILEKKYPEWDGLNLTWETLEGIVKHNGPFLDKTMPVTLALLSRDIDFELQNYASLEAQIAGLSDDIAYNNHDVEDGINAGLFAVEDVAELALFKPIYEGIRNRWPDLEKRRVIAQLVREMIGAMVTDVLAETRSRLSRLQPQSCDDIRAAGAAMVGFSAEMEANLGELRDFLHERMYRHPNVLAMRNAAIRTVGQLFEAYMSEPRLLAMEWQNELPNRGDELAKARVVCDSIASMTDRSATAEHKRLFQL